MELFRHTIMPILSSRKPPEIILAILILSLPSLVRWRWTPYYLLITILSHPTKLLCMSGLVELDIAQPRHVSQIYHWWKISLLTLNHQ